MTNSDETIEKEKYKEIYEVCKNAFDAEIDRVDSIDKKAQANLTLVGILLGAGVFKLDFLLQTFPTQHFVLSVLWIILLVGAGGLLLLSVYFCIRTLQVREFQTYPALDTIIEHFVERPVESLHISLAKHFGKVLPNNERALSIKSVALRRAITLTKPGLLLLALFLALSIGNYLAVKPHITGPAKMGQREPTESGASEPQRQLQSQPGAVPSTPLTVKRTPEEPLKK